MQVHQLRYLVALARTGSFSRAAEECHVSQPSLSQQIQKLEEELGERLFDRVRRRARPTAAGEALVHRAARILAELEAAQREVQEGRKQLRGPLTIGALPTIAPYLLPGVLAPFSRAHPAVQMIVHEETTAQLLSAMVACEVDLAIASPPLRDDRFDIEPLFEEELLLALPAGHPLAGRKRIALADLDGERFILMKEGHCLGDQVLNFCHRRDFEPQVSCRSAQMETIQALVQAGLGVSLVPRMAVGSGGTARPVYRSLEAPSPSRMIAAVWLKQRPPGRVGREFLKLLKLSCYNGSRSGTIAEEVKPARR